MTKYKLPSASSLSFLPLRVQVGGCGRVTVGGCRSPAFLPNRRHKTTHFSARSHKNHHSVIFTTSLIRPLAAVFRLASRPLELHGRNDFHAVEEKHDRSPYCVSECPQRRRQRWSIRRSLLHWGSLSLLAPRSDALTSCWC